MSKLIQKIKSLLKSDYVTNASVLMVGTTVGMVIQLIASPILSRFYTDVEFGGMQLFNSLFSILCIVATLRYEYAIMLPKEDKDAYGLTMLASGFSVVFSGLALLVITLLKLSGCTWFGVQEHDWLWFIPIIVMEYGIYSACNYWLNRYERYKNLAINRVIQQLIIAVASVLFSDTFLPVPGVNGLVLGYVLGQGAVMILLIYYVLSDARRMKLKLTFGEYKTLAKRYVRFPVHSMPAGLVNTFTAQIPVFLLSRFFGEGVVGQYYITNRVLGTPITVIGQAVADVFRQKGSAEYAQKGECKKVYNSTFKTLAALAIAPFILLAVIVKPGFALFLGEGWDMAAYFLILMTPFYYIRFVASPLTYMTIIAEKQRFELCWQIGLMIVTGGAMILTRNMNPYWCLTMYSVAYSAMYIIHILYTRKLAQGVRLKG